MCRSTRNWVLKSFRWFECEHLVLLLFSLLWRCLWSCMIVQILGNLVPPSPRKFATPTILRVKVPSVKKYVPHWKFAPPPPWGNLPPPPEGKLLPNPTKTCPHPSHPTRKVTSGKVAPTPVSMWYSYNNENNNKTKCSHSNHHAKCLDADHSAHSKSIIWNLF